MPVFFLHMRGDVGFAEDHEGHQWPTLEAARDEALAAARDQWAHAMITGKNLADRSIEIAEVDGHVLMHVPFTDALPAGLLDR